MNAPSPTEDRLLDSGQAAAYLGVTERWLRRAVDERRFAHIKLGKHLRFKRSVLDAYVEANTRPAQSRPVEPAEVLRPQSRPRAAKRGARSVRKAVAG